MPSSQAYRRPFFVTPLGFQPPMVPVPLRCKVFDIIHSLSHAGGRLTKKHVAKRYDWHYLNKDITSWVHTYNSCQMSKVSWYTSSPLQCLPFTSSKFHHLHVDIVGLFPPSHGYLTSSQSLNILLDGLKQFQ